MTLPYGLLNDILPQNPLPVPGMIPLLSPQAPMAQIPSSAVPALPVPPTGTGTPMPGAPSATSVMDQMQRGSHSILQSVEQALFPVPQGLQPVLSDADVESARHQAMLGLGLRLLAASRSAPGAPAPSFSQGVAQAISGAGQQFSGDLEGRTQAMAQGLQTLQTVRTLQNRENVAKQFAAQPGETPRQTLDRLRSMYAAYALSGDTAELAALNPVISALGQDPSIQRLQYAKNMDTVDLGDRTMTFDPETHTLLGVFEKGAVPISDKELAQLGLTRSNSMFQRTRAIADAFDKETADAHVVADYENAIQANAPQALAGSKIAQAALATNFVKLVNPQARATTGVDLAQVMRDGGVSDQIITMIQKVLGHGAALSPAEVTEIVDSSARLTAQWKTRTRQTLQKYQDVMSRAGGDPSALIDPFYSAPTTVPSMTDVLNTIQHQP